MELEEADRPPEQIWLQPELLDAHFQRVRNRHEAKKGGMEPIEDDDSMMQSDLTRGLIRKG